MYFFSRNYLFGAERPFGGRELPNMDRPYERSFTTIVEGGRREQDCYYIDDIKEGNVMSLEYFVRTLPL